MKALKVIAYILILILAVFLIGGLFLPADYNLEVSTTINKPVDVIFPMVTNYEKRIAWSPWAAMDPDAKNTFIGTPGEIGSSWTWDGDPAKVGKGTATLESIIPGKEMTSKLEFISPQSGVAHEKMTFTETAGVTEVVWRFDQKLGYPVERYVGAFFLDSILGPPLKAGLESLKEQCEKLPEENEVESSDKEEGGA